MIAVIATIETAPGRRNDLLAIMRGLVPEGSRGEGLPRIRAHDQRLERLAGPVHENAVTMIEKWENLAALEAHLKTPHMGEFRQQTEPLRLTLSLQIVEPA